MRYDDNQKERTRARVLAEAAAAIRGKGVERVGVAEVMAGAGLTHGGFYAHFKSKDDLLTEAISYMFDDAYASFLRHTEGRAPADALSNYIDAYLATSHRDDRAHSCPLAALSGDLPNMPALARARFADGTERLVAALAKLVKKLGAKNAEALAWSALAKCRRARAVANRVRCRQVDANPAQFACDGSVAPRPLKNPCPTRWATANPDNGARSLLQVSDDITAETRGVAQGDGVHRGAPRTGPREGPDEGRAMTFVAIDAELDGRDHDGLHAPRPEEREVARARRRRG
jgi:TetR/AcrR family transcriptional repressor of nem operon